MTTRPWAELKAKVLADPVRRARVEEGASALRDGIGLSQLRSRRGLTEYPDPRDAKDADIVSSKNNDGEDVYVAALRSYIEAMGGLLEIRAEFPDSRWTLLPNHHWVDNDEGNDLAAVSAEARSTSSRSL